MAEIVEFIKTQTGISNLIVFQKKFGNKDDIHRCLQFGQQAIHVACRYGNLKVVNYLISQGCKLDVSDMSGWKPINWAIQNNNVEITKILIDNGCSIYTSNDVNPCLDYTNQVRGNTWQPIHHACLIGNLEITKLLIGKGCDIESRYNICWRPIHIACKYGRFDVANLLIESNCDIDVGCENDWRPIHYACYFGYVDIVDLLCKHQHKYDHKTADDLTAMDLALNNKNEQLIEVVKNWKLIYDTAKAMELQCDSKCHHEFCLKSFFRKTFKKGEYLGKGSFGSVYLCDHSNINRKFALKKISIENNDKKFQKYIENNINQYREIIAHPRIIQYFGVCVKNQYLCLFMEFAAGGSLHSKIQTNLCHGKIISYTREILEGVEFLHNKKIIHRDIKPSNILLDINDNIKLCDFGLSRSLEDPAHEKSTVFASTECGTIIYMAPEILTTKNYKYSADIWSVGVTVIEMVSGKLPYSEKASAIAVMEIISTLKIVYEPITQMSKEFEDLIEAMMNPDYENRATANELLSFPIFDIEK